MSSDAVASINDAIRKFESGEITLQQLQSIVQQNGAEISFWNPATQRHPAYPEGDNRSRAGFTYHPSHPRGRFFQGIIKKAILRAIDFAHHSIIKHYDPDGFVYDDERLKRLDSFLKQYIAENFQHAYPYKSDFMQKVIDIILFLMKEDVYYRARFLDIISKLSSFDFELDQLEKENIERWH